MVKKGKTHACVQQDGMDELLDKVIGADVIVLAVPVYFYSMAAQMKIFIDRCFARYTEIKNKQFYFIVTAADPQRSAAEETIAGLRGFLRCLPGAEEGKGRRLRHRGLGQGGRTAASRLWSQCRCSTRRSFVCV